MNKPRRAEYVLIIGDDVLPDSYHSLKAAWKDAQVLCWECFEDDNDTEIKVAQLVGAVKTVTEDRLETVAYAVK